MGTKTQAEMRKSGEEAIEESFMSRSVEICPSITFLKCCIDSIFRIIFELKSIVWDCTCWNGSSKDSDDEWRGRLFIPE
jgi:hypothetical protein